MDDVWWIVDAFSITQEEKASIQKAINKKFREYGFDLQSEPHRIFWNGSAPTMTSRGMPV
jgi:hypothetical protein